MATLSRMGAAALTQNRSSELRTPPSSDTRLMSIRYGMVKRDSVTAKANWAELGCWRVKPPASAQVSGQAATIIATVKASRTGNSTASTRSAKSTPAA